MPQPPQRKSSTQIISAKQRKKTNATIGKKVIDNKTRKPIPIAEQQPPVTQKKSVAEKEPKKRRKKEVQQLSEPPPLKKIKKEMLPATSSSAAPDAQQSARKCPPSDSSSSKINKKIGKEIIYANKYIDDLLTIFNKSHSI